MQRALHARAEVPGVDILVEDARAAFERTACDTKEVGGSVSARRRCHRAQIDAEWVVGVEMGDIDAVGDASGTGDRTDEYRFRSRLVSRRAIVEQALRIQLDVLRGVVAQARKQRLALRRRQQQVQGRKVEAVRVGEMMVRAGIRIVRIPHRSRRAIVQRHTVEMVRARSGVRSRHGGIAESEPPLRRPRAPRVQPRVGLRIGGLPPLRRADPVLVVEARGEEPGELAARATGAEARLGRAATFAEVAGVPANLEALEFLARDDVDHARDGIGAVDRGCAIFQHLDVIDNGQRDGVEVGAAADTGG